MEQPSHDGAPYYGAVRYQPDNIRINGSLCAAGAVIERTAIPSRTVSPQVMRQGFAIRSEASGPFRLAARSRLIMNVPARTTISLVGGFCLERTAHQAE